MLTVVLGVICGGLVVGAAFAIAWFTTKGKN